MSLYYFLNNEYNASSHLDDNELAEVFNLLASQLATDDLVEDSFREALNYDLEDFGDETHGAVEWCELFANRDEIMDLCDIVEFLEKGFII